jgi:hypothetical protein
MNSAKNDDNRFGPGRSSRKDLASIAEAEDPRPYFWDAKHRDERPLSDWEDGRSRAQSCLRSTLSTLSPIASTAANSTGDTAERAAEGFPEGHSALAPPCHLAHAGLKEC